MVENQRPSHYFTLASIIIQYIKQTKTQLVSSASLELRLRKAKSSGYWYLANDLSISSSFIRPIAKSTHLCTLKRAH